jgi:hypothetical protein
MNEAYVDEALLHRFNPYQGNVLNVYKSGLDFNHSFLAHAAGVTGNELRMSGNALLTFITFKALILS